MPLAGFVAARGQMSLIAALIAGVVGTLLGNAFWYELSRAIGADRIRPMVGRYGRWFAVGEEDLRKAEATLAKYGPVALSFGLGGREAAGKLTEHWLAKFRKED